MPELVSYRNGVLAAISIVALGIAFRLGKDALDGGITGGYTTTGQDHEAEKIKRMLDPLFTPPTTKPSEFPWRLFFEILAFTA